MQSGMINKVAITAANVTDSRALKNVCSKQGAVYADKGYCTAPAVKAAKQKGVHLAAIKRNNMKAVAVGHKPHNVRLLSDKDRHICFQVCDYGQFKAKLAKIAGIVLKFGLNGITFHIPSESTTLQVDEMKLDFSDHAVLAKYSDSIKLHAFSVHESFKTHLLMDRALLRKTVASKYKLMPDSRIYIN